MMNKEFSSSYPYLMTRLEASKFLGIDPKSFDKYIRSKEDLKRFYVGNQERYTIENLVKLIQNHSI